MNKIVLVLLVIIMTHNLSSMQAHGNAYNYKFKSIDGSILNLSKYKNNVLLIVNTASRCGFTRQYTALQSLWDQYKSRGLVVLGVPSGDFGNQELSSNKDIKEFCTINYNINFPMTTRSHVKGPKSHPFYKWAITQVGFTGKPQWNFHKFLIGPNGQIVDWFSSVTKPDSQKVRAKIEEQLALIKPD